MDVVIRKAKIEDINEIAKVSAYTWKNTYTGLMPDEILDLRIANMNEIALKMSERIENYNNVYVADVAGQVVGFLIYSKSRDEKYPDVGEIDAIYVSKEYQGYGIGKKLFFQGIKEIINLGYNDMLLNVLKGNKTINFYEKYGGKKSYEKEEYIGDTLIVEYVMYFENIKEIINENNIQIK